MKKTDKPISIVRVVVAVILGIIAVAAFVLFPVFHHPHSHCGGKTLHQLKTIESALAEYKNHHGYYPQQQKPMALTVGFLDDPNNWKAIPKFADKIPSEHIWTGRYGAYHVRDGKLLDPYDGHFWYLCPGKMNKEGYDLWSTGPDGGHGDGGGEDAGKALNTGRQ